MLDFYLEAGVSWKYIISWHKVEEEKIFFFFPRMIYHQLFESDQMSARLEALLRKRDLFI